MKAARWLSSARWGVLALGGFALTVAPEPAAADQPDGTGRACIVKGKTFMPRNLTIYDAPTGGNAIGKFTGAKVELVAYDFPKSAGGRAAVQTGTGTGSGNFRIEGWAEASKLPLYTKGTIPVVRGHVWMGAKQDVSFVAAKKDRMKVKQQVKWPMGQTYKAWAACTSLTMTPGTPPGWNVPGKARGYVVKKDSIELFDTYQRDRTAVATIFNTSEEGVLMWSTEPARGGFVHVVHHGQVVLDGWARFRDLKRLPWGETMDQQTRAKRRYRSGPKLAVQGDTKKVKASKEVAIRTEPKDSAPMVGVIEVDAEVLVLDIVVGFASVLPVGLNVAPENHFWVDAKELGALP